MPVPLAALVLDFNQGGALGLGLDHSGRLAIHEQQVVDATVTLSRMNSRTATPRPVERLA
jgi:hypothetical protein